MSRTGTALNLWINIDKCITKLDVFGNHNKHFYTAVTCEVLCCVLRSFALTCCFLLQVRSANGGNRFVRTVGTDQRHYRRRSTSLRHLSVHNPRLQTKGPTPCSLQSVRFALFTVHRAQVKLSRQNLTASRRCCICCFWRHQLHRRESFI